MPSLHTHAGALIRLLGYAVTTALATLGLAYLLSGQTVNERRQTFEEVKLHRVATRCMQADLAEAVNRLLKASGLELMPVPETDPSLDCRSLDHLDLRGTPAP